MGEGPSAPGPFRVRRERICFFLNMLTASSQALDTALYPRSCLSPYDSAIQFFFLPAEAETPLDTRCVFFSPLVLDHSSFFPRKPSFKDWPSFVQIVLFPVPMCGVAGCVTLFPLIAYKWNYFSPWSPEKIAHPCLLTLLTKCLGRKVFFFNA